MDDAIFFPFWVVVVAEVNSERFQSHTHNAFKINTHSEPLRSRRDVEDGNINNDSFDGQSTNW
jgi:hypothetical protein